MNIYVLVCQMEKKTRLADSQKNVLAETFLSKNISKGTSIGTWGFIQTPS